MIIANEEERKFITDILASDPDAELREEIRKTKMNGEYTFEICRKCKGYKANLDGNVATAKIVDSCRDCFDNKKGK